MGVYEEIIEEIQLYLSTDIEKARYKIEEELSMPYIPLEIEKKLKELYKQCTRESSSSLMKEEDEIIASLFMDSSHQMMAVNLLLKQNLRQYIDDIHRYFETEPYIPAACLLIEGMIEQLIDESFNIEKDGCLITFNPSYLQLLSDNESFYKALDCLEQWFAYDNPSQFQMAKQCFIHEAYCSYPLLLEDDDAYSLAVAVAHLLITSMNDEEEWEKFVKEHQITTNKIMKLSNY